MFKTRLIIVSLLASLLVGFSFTTSAEAVFPSCRGKLQNRADTWTDVRVWQHPARIGFDNERIRLTNVSYYRFCPNKRGPAKVRPFSFTYCYTLLTGETGWFRGIVMDSVYADDGREFSPWARTVPNDGTSHNCESHDIHPTHWLKLIHSAHRKSSAKIIRRSFPDTRWEGMKTGEGHFWKFYKPWFDAAVSAWYR